MHLHRAALANYYRDNSNCNNGGNAMYAPRVIYFSNVLEFPEITKLLERTVQEYNLDMLSFNNTTFVDGLKSLTSDGNQLAFVLGTRVGDPNSEGQEFFTPSSNWMPPFMRVNPIINWNYGTVWKLLRSFDLPYCSLYDDGYTSLGKLGNTVKTEALRKDGGDEYWPAYCLREEDYGKERDGRVALKQTNVAL